MKIRSLFLVFIFVASAMLVSAQRRTVTNADLERYRHDRVQAQADLRENYDRLGFPPPDEIARRNEKSRREMLELSAKLIPPMKERRGIALRCHPSGIMIDPELAI